jgi:hypothetical protein
MPSVAREYFTVDLRGLRAALAARAARDGMTESDVLRSALAAALGNDHVASAGPPTSHREVPPRGWKVKLSVRLLRPAAIRLGLNAGAAGLSRGAYLTRLVNGAPAVASSADRAALANALNNSSAELAIMSRDINHLTQLLRKGSVEAARSYAARHEALDADVRAHLARAAAVLAEISLNH